MNRRNIIILGIIVMSSSFHFANNLNAQKLISSEFLGFISESFLELSFQEDFRNGVDLYKILYETYDIEGKLDTASGLALIPDIENETYPICIYQHGTVGSRSDVPSNLRGGYQLALALSAFGYICVAPDYLGMGESRGFQSYLHADSEASAAIDLTFAVKDFVNGLSVSVNDQLFVTGYSQGGHSALAALRTLEENYAIELPVTAAAPMSGPYNLSGMFSNDLLTDRVYPTVAYLPLTLLSFQHVYKNLIPGDELDHVFQSVYTTDIQLFRDETIDLWELNDRLITKLIQEKGSAIPRFLIQDSLLVAMQENPDHPINVALKKNDLFDWVPNTPTRLIYCKDDDQVFANNSTFTDSIMNANGAKDVLSINAGDNLNHTDCVLPAAFLTLDFFEGFRTISSTSSSFLADSAVKIFPNPAIDFIEIDVVPGFFEKELQIELYHITGKLIYRETFNYLEHVKLPVTGTYSGMHIVRINDGEKQIVKPILISR